MDITSANSTFTLTPQLGSSVLSGLIPALAGAGFLLQGYAADDAFTADTVDIVEARKGVDGRFSAGFLPSITPMTVVFMADSPSIDILDPLINAQKTLRQPIFYDGNILLPSVGRSYALVNGVLTRITPIPPAKRV